MNKIFTSSKSDNWETPDWLFKQLDNEFHFEVDAACAPSNKKCNHGFYYFDETDNALNRNWYDFPLDNGKNATSIFCNPPYNNLKQWIDKGYEASKHGCTVVFLLPLTKCDQKWWHNIVIPYAAEIRFIEGRVKFGGCENAAPFPSCVVVFKPNTDDWKVSSLRKIT